MKKKALIITIIAINVILIGSILTIYFIAWNPKGETGYLTISGLDDDIKLSLDELRNLPNISQEYTIQGNPTFTANYTGVSVYYLITEIANVTSEVDVKIKASDGYAYTLTFNEINSTRDIIIAYMRDGALLKSGKVGGNGPLRLIIPQRFEGEYNGQFCVKYVVTLEIL